MGGGSVGKASIEIEVDVNQAAKDLNKLRASLNALERAKFAPGTKTAAAASREIGKLNQEIKDLGGTVDKSGNFINRHAAAINQLAFSAARAGSGFANFLPIIARVSTLLAKHEFGEGGIGGALRSLKEKFSGAAQGADGLAGAGGKAATALKAINIGAVSAIAAVAALAAGILFLTFKLGPLGSALIKAQQSIKLIFEEGGEDMLKFARSASAAFGITEQAALRFVGKTGQLFKSFGVGAEAAGTLSKGLLAATDVLRSTSTEFIDSATGLQAMNDTIAGNVEGLRIFDIFLTEIGLTQVAVRNGLKQTSGAFDNVQRSLVSGIAAIEAAQERFEQYRETMDSTQRTAERTKAAFADIQATIGTGLVPILAWLTNTLFGVLIVFRGWVNSISDFLKRSPRLISALKAIMFISNLINPLAWIAKGLSYFTKKGEEAAESASSLDETAEALEKALKKLREEFNKHNKELTAENLIQLRDAHIRLTRAIEDSARAEQKAHETLARAREDGIRKVEDAQRKLFRATRDGNRAIDKARKDVADAELDRKRAIRDAEEKLAETRLDSNKKVENAEKALAKAREARAKAIFHAQLSLEDALFAQDAIAERRALVALADARSKSALEDAQRSLEEARVERLKDIAKAERVLAETIVDQDKKVAEARLKLMETIEETAENIADALRELHETEIETNRALYDARQALLAQQIQGTRNIIDAETALDDLNHSLGTTDLTLAQILDKLERIRNTILSTPGFDGSKSRGAFAHGPQGKGNADGGWIPGGRASLVGERGPELFIPNRSGTVVSNEQLVKVLNALGNNSGSGQPIIIHEAADPDATAFAVSSRLVRNVNN